MGLKWLGVQSRYLIYFFADDALFFTKANVEEATVLKKCLSDYELASGQQVNFSKSAIMFTPHTTSVEIPILLCSTLGVEEVDSHGTYLGMPLIIGRKKKQNFHYVKEKK